MGEMPVELEQVLEETGWLARYEAKCEARYRARWEAEGEEMWRRKEGIEIARKMKYAGRPCNEIEEFTGLPTEVITTL